MGYQSLDPFFILRKVSMKSERDFTFVLCFLMFMEEN